MALAVAASLFAACGFHPLYGDAGAADTPAELAEIKIGPIKNRHGQILRNELLTLLTPKGEPERPRYLLTVDYADNVQELAFRLDGFATRGNLALNVSFTLSATDGKGVLFIGAESRTAAFNILRSEYATEAARDDAFKRAAAGVARDIRVRLAVFFFGRQSTPRPANPS